MNLPKGLVGIKSTAYIIIGGKEVGCLLDTGSQVTMVPQSFYEAHLSDHQLKSLENLHLGAFGLHRAGLEVS